MCTTNRKVILFLATGGFCGLVPLMPGTVGTAIGIIIFLALAPLKVPLYLFIAGCFILFAIWCAGQAELLLQKKDPSAIVIDEIAGFLVTMISLPPVWIYIAAGFILFRLMDIIKPWPVSWINDNVTGGSGVVFDDVLAGVYANLVLQVIRHFV